MLDYKTFVQLFVRQLQLSKTKLCVVNKTKQKDESVARPSAVPVGKLKATETMSCELLTDQGGFMRYMWKSFGFVSQSVA